MNYLEFFSKKGGKVFEPNLFIHGIQEDVTNATELGSYLSVANESNIFNFKLNNKGVSCFIDSSFSFPRMSTNSITQKIISIIYLGENNAEISDSPSMSSDIIPKIRNIASTSLFNIGDRTFFNTTPLNYCLIPKTTQIGSTLDDNQVFISVRNNGNAVFSQAAETANAGSPDVDIQTLISKNWNIKYSQNDTKPTAPTISANTIGGTYVELSVSQPTHVNDLKYALVFVNGFFQDLRKYTSGSFFVGGLTPEISHEIKVIIADEYFNISSYSNTINVTTTAIPVLFQNAVAYYKLDETTGDAIDVINNYNGTLFGGVTQGVAGKKGTAYGFDGTGSVNLGNIIQKIDPDDFTISVWASTNQTSGQFIFSDLVSNLFENRRLELSFSGVSEKIIFTFVDNDTVQISSINNYQINQLYFITVKYSVALGVAELKIDNVSQGTVNITGNPSRPFNDLYMGVRGSTQNLGLNGIIDEVAFINGQTTAAQDSDLYNNGLGTTI